MLIYLLRKVEMPTFVGISTFMSKKIFKTLGPGQVLKSFKISGPGQSLGCLHKPNTGSEIWETNFQTRQH